MQKPNPLRLSQLVATLFCTAKLAVDIWLIVNNYFSLQTAALGSLSETALPTNLKLCLITEALLMSLPIGIIAAVNYAKTDMVRRRGITTMIVTGIAYLINSLGSIAIDKAIGYFARKTYGDATSALVDSLNSQQSFLVCLIHAGAIIIFSCAAVEIYGGKKVPENA